MRFYLGFTPATAASTLQWAIPAPALVQVQLRRHFPYGAMHGGHCDGEVASSTQLNSSELEIEKKFCIPNEQAAMRLEQTLSSLGFTICHKEEFVDWYFDLPAPNWYFSLNDCWIRYREKKVKVVNNRGWKGSWQVKRGNKEEKARRNHGMTVYDEFHGEEAKRLIRDMVLQQGGSIEEVGFASSTINSNYDGHDVPYLAGAESLVPFARINTIRTCFEAATDIEYSNLKVDIDKTNFGHMVGEVEAVVEDCSRDEEHMEELKEKISRLVDLISSKSELGSPVDAIGKLEYLLINNRRDLYDACIKAGSLER